MKLMKLFGVALVATVLGAGFTACSDDDDDDNGNGSSSSSSNKVSIITNNNGEELLLTSVLSSDNYDDMHFKYDTQGRCTYIGHDDAEHVYTISYNPYKIAGSYGNGGTEKINLSFNDEGYVTKIASTYTHTMEDGRIENEDGTFILSYEDGHLTKASLSVDWEMTGQSSRNSCTTTYTATLTWKDNNMTKLSFSFDELYNNGDNRQEEGTCTYEYSDTKNDCKQHTIASIYSYGCYDLYFLETFAFVGYIGKGTAYLPKSMEYDVKETYDEDGYRGEESWTDSYSFNYTKNSDGTISTEKAFGDTYTYSYSWLDGSTRSAVAAPWNGSEEDRTLVSQRHRHHNAE